MRLYIHVCRVVLNDKSASVCVTCTFSCESGSSARFIRSASLFEEKFTGVPADYRQ